MRSLILIKKAAILLGIVAGILALLAHHGWAQVPMTGAGKGTPTTILPTVTWRAGKAGTGTGTSQTASTMSIGAAAARRMVIVGVTNDSSFTGATPSITITPNTGTAKSGSVAVSQASGTAPIAIIFYAVLDADADTATTVDLSLTYPSNPFAASAFNVWTVPSADLSSTTPVDAKKSQNTATNTVSITTLTQSAGGFVVVASENGNVGANSISWAGSSETYTTDRSSTENSGYHVAAHANGVSAFSGNANVTATYGQTDQNVIAAASWR